MARTVDFSHLETYPRAERNRDFHIGPVVGLDRGEYGSENNTSSKFIAHTRGWRRHTRRELERRCSCFPNRVPQDLGRRWCRYCVVCCARLWSCCMSKGESDRLFYVVPAAKPNGRKTLWRCLSGLCLCAPVPTTRPWGTFRPCCFRNDDVYDTGRRRCRPDGLGDAFVVRKKREPRGAEVYSEVNRPAGAQSSSLAA